MNHAEHFALAADRCADDARGQDLALAVAAAELAVVHHIAGQHGLAVAHHRRRQELRHAMVAMRRIAARGDRLPGCRPAALAVGRRACSSTAPASTCVPSNNPSSATFASVTTSVAFASSNASRHRLAAARPTFGNETSTSSSSGGSRKRLWPRRCVIVVGSYVSSTLSSSGGPTVGSPLVFLVDRLRRAQHRVRIGKRLRQIVHERQVRIADPNDVARLQLIVALNPLAVDERAVAAIEIAQRPLALRLKHLGMVAAAALVLDDDRIGRRPADRDRFAVDQTEHVGPFRAFANNQVCRHRIIRRQARQEFERPRPARTCTRKGDSLADRPSSGSPIDRSCCQQMPLLQLIRRGGHRSSRFAQNRHAGQGLRQIQLARRSSGCRNSMAPRRAVAQLDCSQAGDSARQ